MQCLLFSNYKILAGRQCKLNGHSTDLYFWYLLNKQIQKTIGAKFVIFLVFAVTQPACFDSKFDNGLVWAISLSWPFTAKRSKIFQGNKTINVIGIEGSIIFVVDIAGLKLVFVILATFLAFFGARWSSHTISRSSSVTPTLPPTSWGLNGPQSVSWYPQFVKLWNQWGPMSGQCVLWSPFGKSFPRTTVFPHLRDGSCEHKSSMNELWKMEKK